MIQVIKRIAVECQLLILILNTELESKYSWISIFQDVLLQQIIGIWIRLKGINLTVRAGEFCKQQGIVADISADV